MGGVLRALLWTWLLLSTSHTGAQTSSPAELESGANSAALLDKYTALEKQLGKTPFGRPLVLESFEDTGSVSGNAYAVLDASFNMVSTTFKGPSHWCDVMILHINTKYCRAASETSPTRLKVNIGKKRRRNWRTLLRLNF